MVQLWYNFCLLKIKISFIYIEQFSCQIYYDRNVNAPEGDIPTRALNCCAATVTTLPFVLMVVLMVDLDSECKIQCSQ